MLGLHQECFFAGSWSSSLIQACIKSSHHWPFRIKWQPSRAMVFLQSSVPCLPQSKQWIKKGVFVCISQCRPVGAPQFFLKEGLKNGNLDESVRPGRGTGECTVFTYQAHSFAAGFGGREQLRRWGWGERIKPLKISLLSVAWHLLSVLTSDLPVISASVFVHQFTSLFKKYSLSTFVTVTGSHDRFLVLFFNLLIVSFSTKTHCSVLISLEDCLFFRSR